MFRFLVPAFALVAVGAQMTIGGAHDAVYLAAAALAAVAPWIALRWRRPEVTAPWRAMGIGLGLILLGDVLFVVVWPWLLSTPDPAVSVADVAYLAGYAAIVIAILGMSRLHRADHDVDLLLDAAAVSVGLVVLLLPLAVVPALDDGASTLEALVNLVYPLADAVLLGAVIRMVSSRAGRSPSGLLLSAGLAGWLVADLSYLVSFATDGYGFGDSLLDGAWTLSAVAITAGVLHPSMVALAPTAPLAEPSKGRGRLVVSLLSLASVPVVVLFAPDVVARSGTAVWAVLTILLAGVVAWRVLRVFAARERADAELVRTIRYFRALAANSSDALLAVGPDGVIEEGAPGLAALLGRHDIRAEGVSMWDRVHPDDVASSQRRFADVLARPGEIVDGEVRIIDFKSRVRTITTRAINLLDDPDVGRVIINVDDVTASRAAEAELERQTYLDAVTGLDNRAALRRHLQVLSGPPAGGQRAGCLLLLDLDGFTSVNERFGYDRGDELLRRIGERLRSMSRASDRVARIGGDEFAILIEDRGGGAEAEAFAQRLIDAFRVPFPVGDEKVVVGVTIGIAMNRAGDDHELVLRDAVVAVHEAKVLGKGRVIVFQETMRHAASDRLLVETDLVGALERDELELYYQPIRDLSTGRTAGFEALIRWNHPRLGLIPPDRFIPVAEANGLIVPIGAWVVATACAQVAAWRRTHCPDLHMSVNVSTRQLTSIHLVDVVRAAIEGNDIPASALTIEITETTLVDDPRAAASRLRELEELGVTIAIDDFGTGYSSLSYLRQFPVDVVKVDRSFVNLIDGSGATPPIVRGVLELARTLHLATVAEGIEEEHQLAQLRAEGCDMGQGYLFSRPVPAAEATALLDEECPSSHV